MRLSWSRETCVLLLLACAAGCAPALRVIVSPAALKTSYHSAYVVVHGGTSSDMDANIPKEILGRGFSVSAGAKGEQPASAELLVEYSDRWAWDLAMYLANFELSVFDAKTKLLLASGSWKDSEMHGFHSGEEVVGQVVAETLGKLNQGN